MAQKGLFKKVVKLKMTKNYVLLAKGSVIEFHPNMARKLIELEVAEPSKDKLTKNRVLPTAKLKK